MDWQQISFEVQKSEVDLISEILMGIGSLAITFSDACQDDIYEPPVGEMPLWDNIILTALFSSEVSEDLISTAISEICNINILENIELKDRIWEEECQKNFPSMQFGKNLWVRPYWDEAFAIPSDSIAINIDPGLAFGTGAHQTTSLCLEFLDENPPQNLDVIDYGCGSGLLAIAAAKLNARSVVAIDHDPQAIISSRENIAKNHCENDIKVINANERLEYGYCDLLIANILVNPLIKLEPLFLDILKPNGVILLSGVLKNQLEVLLECYSINFYNFIIKSKDEWISLSAKKNIKKQD